MLPTDKTPPSRFHATGALGLSSLARLNGLAAEDDHGREDRDDEDGPPDVGADAQVMAWFFDTLAQTTPESQRQDQSRAVVGKPAELGGLVPRTRALADVQAFFAQTRIADN